MMNPDDTDDLHGEELVFTVSVTIMILTMHF